jgi:hypothetical protein
MSAKFDYDDIVTTRMGLGSTLRPGSMAWIVGITPESKRSGKFLEEFPRGTTYTIEFEDGVSVEVQEADIQLADPQPDEQ